MKKILMTAAAATAFISTAAFAAVNFDSEAGTGWVGKGDVQLAFGWNNKAAQTNANAVTFGYVDEVEYAVHCQKEIGGVRNTRTEYKTFKRKRGVNATVSYDARLKNQYTGYSLLGFSDEGSTDDGGNLRCPGNEGWDPDETMGDDYIEVVSATGGGLTVTYNGQTVPLPNTPTL